MISKVFSNLTYSVIRTRTRPPRGAGLAPQPLCSLARDCRPGLPCLWRSTARDRRQERPARRRRGEPAGSRQPGGKEGGRRRKNRALPAGASAHRAGQQTPGGAGGQNGRRVRPAFPGPTPRTFRPTDKGPARPLAISSLSVSFSLFSFSRNSLSPRCPPPPLCPLRTHAPGAPGRGSREPALGPRAAAVPPRPPPPGSAGDPLPRPAIPERIPPASPAVIFLLFYYFNFTSPLLGGVAARPPLPPRLQTSSLPSPPSQRRTGSPHRARGSPPSLIVPRIARGSGGAETGSPLPATVLGRPGRGKLPFLQPLATGEEEASGAGDPAHAVPLPPPPPPQPCRWRRRRTAPRRKRLMAAVRRQQEEETPRRMKMMMVAAARKHQHNSRD
ncbi:uncharacterized protein LOC131592078 [Poecile atricapillus]|uniref:uncharacterized protein LOC131572557 n=1 Tax=Poecile atricapillus TaxID=48891 RepID=UPI0027384652|nr:uncharacterized protein LOC131572557 [Poecile atricapillus]XP_058719337.1 uncharacterized protein LOC131592078 [Poecile atricapillus]